MTKRMMDGAVHAMRSPEQFLAVLIDIKRTAPRTFGERDEDLAEALIDTLPPSDFRHCIHCARHDVATRAVQGSRLCRAHLRRYLANVEPTRSVSRDAFLAAPRAERTSERIAFVKRLIDRARMGNPAKVADRDRAHATVDSLEEDERIACPMCVDEGLAPRLAWALAGIFLCRLHAHEAIDRKVVMTAKHRSPL